MIHPEIFRLATTVALITVWVAGDAIGAAEESDHPASAEDAIRAEYLRQRDEERAAAEQTVAELSPKNPGEISPEDSVRLFRAYNELGRNLESLQAINQVPESYLAKHGLLDHKATAFHNVNFNIHFDGSIFATLDKPTVMQELLFFDRCIDRRYGNLGVWYWKKAKLLCRTSVSAHFDRRSNQSYEYVIDRERYEYAFELLERAFEVEPKLLQLDEMTLELMFNNQFPLLDAEPRFKQLLALHEEDIPADADAAVMR